MTIEDIQRPQLLGEQSAVQAVTAAIERAEAASAYYPTISIIRKRALQRAADIDAARANGRITGDLAGVPFIAKDNMLAFGAPTTAGARMLEHFDAPFQAEVIERLEAAGAILVAKANLDAFAHGGSTENSAFGATKNPHDSRRISGGSSGGSAASVALDIVPFALGSDTGGSIRQPASFCGVVGVKPTYGRVSRYGVVAMASSTDTIGVLSNTATDADRVMRIISGVDVKDSTTIRDDYASHELPKRLRIGVVEQWRGDGVQAAVAVAIDQRIEQLRSQGHDVETVSLTTLEHALAVYYVIVPAEIASNLARYDGVRYGERASAADLSAMYRETRSHGFMSENQRRIMIGNYVLSSGYYDAYFKKAASVRTLIIDDFRRAFEKYDILVGPVAPTVAPKIGEKTSDPLTMYMMDIMTVPASLAGLPAISVPVAHDDDDMPIGMQLIAAPNNDRILLDLATQMEQVS